MALTITKNLPHRPLQLFLHFFRLGCTAFGGPAMIAQIREMAVSRYQWLDREMFGQGLALCQTIPGATAMQMAAYVGLRHGGFWGSVAAYTGFGLPAFCIMTVLAALYQRGHSLAQVIALFAGMQVAVVALMVNATLVFGRPLVPHPREWGLGLAMAAALAVGLSPILAILASAAAGLVLFHPRDQAGTDKRSALPPNMLRGLLPALLLGGLVLLLTGLLAVVNPPLCTLAVMMLKIDLLAFGGGYGSVPLMFNEVVLNHQWLSAETLMDGIALGQITPGPIVITAAFVGYLKASFLGALVATAAIFSPSLIILLALAPTFDRLRHNSLFQRATKGIQVSFAGLLLAVTVRFAIAVPWDLVRVALFLGIALALWRNIALYWILPVIAAISLLGL